MKYDHKQIESKWQRLWEKEGIYKDYGKKKKVDALDMFPYPSGAGLHVGHPKGYIATDVFARYKILRGFSVLHPMGWDAFGLPAENYALANKIHPRIAAEKNIATFKEQLEKFGFTYDWGREINTTNQEYYKWTQWIFLQMFKRGLAYESDEPINWCPKCKTGLALEDLEGGLCERCGTQVVQKKMRQWALKMTAYADRLLYDLDKKNLDWEEQIKEQQKNWIGRSEGAEFRMRITPFNKGGEGDFINVYTTRLDTVFGMTYAVVAPEHEIIEKLKDKVENYAEAEQYIIKAQNKTGVERMEQKEKTGIELKGIKAANPFTNEQISVFVADYVLGGYGTGAVMAVPAHDERDFEFAKKYNLPIKTVILRSEATKDPVNAADNNGILRSAQNDEGAFTNDGILINSGEYDGLTSEQAREKMTKWLKEKGIGGKKVNYKMRDWVFSRQRYWGEPFPLVFCEHCAEKIKNQKSKIKNNEFNAGELLNPGWIAVAEDNLPVRLPEVESYEPTGTGESPLANIKEWVETTCPKCGGPARRETNTMPQWAGSCWYYLRYIDPKNNKALIDKKEEKKWMPVDLYVGGIEHATRHLLYARFWHKFLYDIGVVSTDEPFKRLIHVGLILAEDGRKMSKRWNNVINPDDVIEQYGADSIRLYEMFMGPFTQGIAWSTKGVVGVRRFLERVFALASKMLIDAEDASASSAQARTDAEIKITRLLHKTIKKVTEDIESFKFNTAISQMMILLNEMEKEKNISLILYSKFLILLSPFAPHITEELWSKIPPTPLYQGGSNSESIFKQKWPEWNPALVKDKTIQLVIQVNGKVRDTIEVAAEIGDEEAKELAMKNEKVKKWTEGKKIVKVIFAKGKLINVVAK